MPRVGNKKFPYTAEGMKAAKKAAGKPSKADEMKMRVGVAKKKGTLGTTKKSATKPAARAKRRG